MPVAELAYASVGRLLKFNENPDGTLDFEASKATDPTLDSDAQVADPIWARDAMEAWFATGNGGNLRDMHQPVAAGKALTLEHRGDGEYITGRIVDPVSVTKAKHGLYGGLSIGVASPRIVKDVAAPGGRIVGGRIVEISLVDVPANPACRLMLAKADGAGNAMFVEELVEDVAAPVGRIDKVVGVEPTVVANPDDPDAADAEALEKAKKGKPFGGNKAKPFGADGKPAKGDDAESDDDSEDDSDGEDDTKPAKKKNPFAKAAGLAEEDLAAIVKAVLAELPAMQAATADLAKGADAPIEDEPDPAVPEGDPVDKAAEPDLAKGAGVDDEMADLARAKRILADLACLVASEAAGFLSGGGFGEVADMDMLVGVMATLTCFVERETYELEAAAMAETTAASGDTPPVPTVMQLAATPDVEKTAEPAEPATPSLSDELARRLDKAMKKARKAAAAKAATPETPAPVAASTTDTETLTKAVADKVTADLTVQLGDVFTKAMGPVLDRVAEVETLLKSTPRPGGPAVTRVQPQVSPAESVAMAEKAQKAHILKGMLAANPAGPMRAALVAQLADLEPNAA